MVKTWPKVSSRQIVRSVLMSLLELKVSSRSLGFKTEQNKHKNSLIGQQIFQDSTMLLFFCKAQHRDERRLHPDLHPVSHPLILAFQREKKTRTKIPTARIIKKETEWFTVNKETNIGVKTKTLSSLICNTINKMAGD